MPTSIAFINPLYRPSAEDPILRQSRSKKKTAIDIISTIVAVGTLIGLGFLYGAQFDKEHQWNVDGAALTLAIFFCIASTARAATEIAFREEREPLFAV